MSTLSAVGSGGNWSAQADAMSAMKQRMFQKVDADGSGGVDQTELQGLFDHIAKKTGGTAADAATQFKNFDSNSDGNLSADELDQGMRSLMPPPSSTVDFAQRQGGDAASAVADLFSKLDSNGDGGLDSSELKTLTDKLKGSGTADNAQADAAIFKALDQDSNGSISQDELTSAVNGQSGSSDSASAAGMGGSQRMGGPPPGPPPGGGGGDRDGDQGASSTSSSSSTDPLDTNGDGVVSASERAAGELKAALQKLAQAADADGNGGLDTTEAAQFVQQLQSTLQSAFGLGDGSANASNGNGQPQQDGGGDRGRFELRALRDLVRSAYAQADGSSVSSTTGSTVDVAA